LGKVHSALGSYTSVSPDDGHEENGLVVNVVPLPVGPPGGGAPEADLGVCFITQILGPFASDAATARIEAGPTGLYQVFTARSASDPPGMRIDIFCVRFSEFEGDNKWDFSTASTNFISTTATASAPNTTIHGLGSDDTLCTLAGIKGNFSLVEMGPPTVDGDNFVLGAVADTLVDAPDTMLDASMRPQLTGPVTSFGICTRFPGKNWNRLTWSLNAHWSGSWGTESESDDPLLNDEGKEIDVGSGFCFLDRIGNRLGEHDWAEVYTDGSTWRLRTGRKTFAGADCLSIMQ
jgi:hypothetical protein